MSEFNRGVFFTIGLLTFGWASYGLGRIKAQHEEAQRWKQLKKEFDRMREDIEKKEKNN